jgi:formate dehydrogenase subunit gamma
VGRNRFNPKAFRMRRSDSQTPFAPWSPDAAAALVAPHARTRGGLLPALHALQAAFGYIDDAAFPLLAEVFNLSRADVFGVVTFYHDFRRTPPNGRVVKLCRADACRAVGSEELAAHAATRAPNDVTVEAVYCLGLCALGPSAMIDGQPYARMTPARFDALVKGDAP